MRSVKKGVTPLRGVRHPENPPASQRARLLVWLDELERPQLVGVLLPRPNDPAQQNGVKIPLAAVLSPGELLDLRVDFSVHIHTKSDSLAFHDCTIMPPFSVAVNLNLLRIT